MGGSLGWGAVEVGGGGRRRRGAWERSGGGWRVYSLWRRVARGEGKATWKLSASEQHSFLKPLHTWLGLALGLGSGKGQG